MERYTTWIDDNTRGFADKAYDPECGFARPIDMNMILNRLAAYESTGLTPAEVAELARAKCEGRLVEVVRCKDCVNCKTELVPGGQGLICEEWGGDVLENDFCSYGRSRAEAALEGGDG